MVRPLRRSRSRALRVGPGSLLALAATLAVALAACGSSAATGSFGSASPDAASPGASGSDGGAISGWPAAGTVTATSSYPVIASSELVVGVNRFLFNVVDTANNSVASPQMTATVALYDIHSNPSTPVTTTQATFLWAIPDSLGFYVANVTFGHAGEWGAQITTAKGTAAPVVSRIRFTVLQKGTTIEVGQKAPSTPTLTLADVGGDVRKVSTDPSPDPALFEISESTALAEHRPFVLIFATPAFCTSRVCGPTLDTVKAVAAQEPGFTFIGVEPYKMQYKDGSLQPILDSNGQLQPISAVDAWGLMAEPWIFVVDGQGIVRDSYEAVVGTDELKAAIAAVR